MTKMKCGVKFELNRTLHQAKSDERQAKAQSMASSNTPSNHPPRDDLDADIRAAIAILDECRDRSGRTNAAAPTTGGGYFVDATSDSHVRELLLRHVAVACAAAGDEDATGGQENNREDGGGETKPDEVEEEETEMCTYIAAKLTDSTKKTQGQFPQSRSLAVAMLEFPP